MIVDGHAYCFPPLGDANGFPSVREHLRYVQREMADHHQPVWRLADRAPGDNAMLAAPADRSPRVTLHRCARPDGGRPERRQEPE